MWGKTMKIYVSNLSLLCILVHVGKINPQTTGTTCESILLPGYDGCPPWENVPTYFPYPYDCRKFIECGNGDAIVQCCPPGTVWDQNLLVCNHEGVTPCVIVTTTEASSSDPTTTTTVTTTTPTTTTPTTTTPTTTTPTTTTPTTTTPTTTAPTTTRPTTTTPTTTTPTTTTSTTTTPTTTTPTTTTPTTTSPTTTTPTTSTPTTTTPTTTTPTTTRPTTTTTPTTTRPTTTTTRPPTTLPPIEVGSSYRIINIQANRALDAYGLENGSKIDIYTVSSGCTRNPQIWRLDFTSSTSTYVIRSALGESNRWQHAMHTDGRAPHIWEAQPPTTDGYWHVVRVDGTNYWNIYNRYYNSTGPSSLRNTG